MAIMGKHGITSDTSKNVLFGAGTFHKNLTFEAGKWSGTCVGATSGGGKVSIQGEYVDLDLDGALVNFKGQTVKQGGKATMDVNIAEINGDNLKMAANFTETESDADGYAMFVDKPNIEEGDYLENFGYVGKTANGAKDIIVIFEYALCKSAFEIEGKNKGQSVLKAVLEAYADPTRDLDALPVKIYYPTVATV